MRTGRTIPRGAAAAAALALLALLAPGAPRAEAGDKRPSPGAGIPLGVPVDGLDRVRLDDGRVMACRLEEQRGGVCVLKFETFSATVKKSRILEFRKFSDYDSTPRNEEEKASVARGMVRHGGRWVPKDAAEKAVEAEEAAAKKVREEEDKRSKWENRWQIDTEHFHIEANLSRDAVEHYADLLEPFYDFFTRAFGIKLTQRERKKKLPVFLFRRRDEFMTFHNADVGGKSENLLGYFVPAPGQERLVFFDEPGNRKGTEKVMFHEGTHFIIHLAEPKVLVSRWIHEGCAEYFAASGFDGKKFTPGLVQDGRLLHFNDMVARGQVLTMDLLMRGGNPYKDESSKVGFEGEHYAQAWTTVHYLMEGKGRRYRNGFISFLDMLLQRKGKFVGISGSEQVYMELEEAKATLARCLGIKDVESLVDEVKEYAKSIPLDATSAHIDRAFMRLMMNGDVAGAEEDFRIAKEKAGDDPEKNAELARAFMNIPGKFEDAVGLFKKSLELDPLNADNHYFLSQLYARSASMEDALKAVETCLQVDPNHGLALAAYAWYTYVTRFRNANRAGSEEEIAQARRAMKAAERAIALDPSTEGYFSLAALGLVVGDFEKARDSSKTAVEMEPERPDFLWQLAQCYALLGQGEDFARILRRIELLLRREARRGESGEDGGTATGQDPAAAQEWVQQTMADALRSIAERCLSWDKKAEASAALDCWYERRLPKSEDAWYFYASTVWEAGNRKRARKIAADGLKAFPDSGLLKALATHPPGEGETEEPAGGDAREPAGGERLK